MEKLQYITQDHDQLPHDTLCLQACEAGVKWIQLRMKNANSDEFLETAKTCREITRKFGAKLIINDNLEIALASNADGVHLGQKDLSTLAARKQTPDNFIIGGTANTLEEILEHAANGVDYVGVGPFRFTTTKEALSPVLGLEGYLEISQELNLQNVNVPVIAIGGIQTGDVASIMETGVHGIAVSGLITHESNKHDLILTLNKHLHYATT